MEHEYYRLHVKFTKITETAIAPEGGRPTDAGIDLFSDKEITIEPHCQATIPTGIAMAIPNDYFGKIFDRSSVASKTPLLVKAGVIDPSYRGEIKIVMANIGTEPVRIKARQKIAQLVIMPYMANELDIRLVEADELSPTIRGSAGFGSTDKKAN
tara:strand:+ start:3016 stop:3480 length:465 start_codon:yes stop_codon:yes gene_type:complete